VAANPINLADIIIINESNDYGEAGDIQIFRNKQDAYHELEPWYVNESYFAITGNGNRVTLTKDGFTTNEVIIDTSQSDLLILKIWLTDKAEHLHQVRIIKNKRNPKKYPLTDLDKAWQMPQSIEELIQYVGFN
jgi:hypothetical protein